MADAAGGTGDGNGQPSGGPGNATDRTQVRSGAPIGGLETGRPITIDPATVGQQSAEPPSAEPKSRRGRPRKSATASAGTPAFQEAPALDVNGCKAILLSIHTMLLGFTKAPEWAMEEKEAHN